MNLFINHSIEEKNDELIVTLYLDKHFAFEEFSKEFLHKGDKRSLENEVKAYIKSHIPNLKGGFVKIALGTMILTTMPIQTFAKDISPEQPQDIVYTVQAEQVEETAPENPIEHNNDTNEPNETSNHTPGDNETGTEAQDNSNEPISDEAEKSIIPSYENQGTEDINTEPNTEPNQILSIDNIVYSVKSGDTLTKISKQFNIPIDQIKSTNNLTSDTIYVGQDLKIQVTESPSTGKEISDSEEALKDENLPYLHNGIRHHDVIKLKQNLNKLGFLSLSTPTTYFGPTTESGVKKFQNYYGLEVNGIADKETLVKLNEIVNGPMFNGLHRNDVIELKQDLNKLGFLSLSNPTTYFGPTTETSVKRFQNYYGLNVNGIADKETLEKLQEVANSPLQNGKRHNEVIKLKEDLISLNFLSLGNPTNYYGIQTENAVRQFQSQFGLQVNGIADLKTLNKIDDIINGPMYNGLNREDVIPLKKNLGKLGFLDLNNPTTFFGPVTEKATKDFQRKYGLEVTGIADQATVQAIERIINGDSLNIAPPLLKIGVHHNDVIKLKKDLEKVGLKVSNNPTEYYGPTTANKVKEFQSRYNLAADGIAGEETLAKLEEVVNQTIPSPFERTMFPNDSGEDIRLLQTYLNDAGYYVIGQPTTFYGSLTVNQVKEFQQQHGLTPTGTADARTLQKLVSVRESVVENISSFVISGKGYGHAVGMTQWGAYGMASEGYKYEDILKYYYTGTGIGERDTDNQNVRVLLTEKADTLTVSSNKPYQVGDREFLPNTITTIHYQNGEYIIKNGDKTYKRTDTFQISPTGEGLLYFKNKQYEGTFYVSTSSSKLDLVNHLNVENYLKGVVPYEIIPSWDNLDLFKVQTLAARTYVLKEIQRNQGNKFDVFDTVRSQVYNGIPKDIPNQYITKINQAISNTKGEVILYNGVLIDAVYSASSGGHTVDAVDVWGNDIPYLVGKEDPYDKSKYSINWWSVSLSKQELERIFPEVGKVINISVVKTKYNRPTEIRIVGVDKSITVSGTDFRQKIGTSKMLSNTFTVTASVK